MTFQNKSGATADIKLLSQFIERCNLQQAQQVNEAILRLKKARGYSEEQAAAGLAYGCRIALAACAIEKISIDEVIAQLHTARF